MNKSEYIKSVYERYLKKHQKELAYQLTLAIKNDHEKFEPYILKPIHYIVSIYDPLQLHYVLLGKTNLGINLEFKDEMQIDKEIISRLKLDSKNPDSRYNIAVIQLKREIEYNFLKMILDKIENDLSIKIQLYITQHITEVSFDISSMKSIHAEYLWENLEK